MNCRLNYFVLLLCLLGMSKISIAQKVPGKFAPVDGKTMLIIGQDLGSVKGYVDSGKFPTPAGVTMYTDLYSMSGLTDITNYGAGDIGLQESMDLYPNSALSIGFWMREEADGQGEDHPNGLTELVNGQHDDELDKFVAFAKKNAPRPIYLRIGYEFDGNWNGYDANRYKAGYKYIVDYLNAKNVTNVAYVWQSAAWGADPVNIIDNYYPGDEYVDYVGLSFFFYAEDYNSDNLEYIVNYARNRNKPIMMAEVSSQYYEIDQGTYHYDGVTNLGSQGIWDQYFKDQLIPFIEGNDDIIRIVCWINADWQAQPLWGDSGVHWGDTRIETDELISTNWNNYINNGSFLHGGPNLLKDLGIEDGGNPPAPTCNDGIQNGNETGVDCGGSCAPCQTVPPTPTCNDGVQNGDETGVDCGGSCAPCQPTDEPSTNKIEAETASIQGGAQIYDDNAASGGKGVAYLDAQGNGFTIQNAPKADKIELVYASQNSGTISIVINGQNAGKLNFSSNDNWVGSYATASADVTVPAGATFQIVNNSGDQALNVDYINFINNGGGSTDDGPCTGNDRPSAVVSKTDETKKGNNDGSITFAFDDTEGRTGIEFSIDGGSSYPYNVRDNSGSTTISNLAPATYQLSVRWGNNQCPVSLGTATINEGSTNDGDPTPPTCNDNIQNGDETGVDCGGSCKPCGDTGGDDNLTAALLPPKGQILLTIGQDLKTVADYKNSGKGYPEMGGVTQYLAFYSLTDPGNPQYGALGEDLSGTPTGNDINWGAGPLNAHSGIVGFPGSSLSIGMSMAEGNEFETWCAGCLAATGNGRHDDKIKRLAKFANDHSDVAIYLRIGFEFDGAWNRYESGAYKSAFRRIVEVMRSEGVSNVAYVWQACSSPVDDLLDGYRENIEDFYPGDDVVDWVGYSWFLSPDRKFGNAATQRELADEVVNFARARKKPVKVCESSPQGYDISELTRCNIVGMLDGDPKTGCVSKTPNQIWNEWFTPFFEYIYKNKDVIRGVDYINVNWDEDTSKFGPGSDYAEGYWGDARVQSNPAISNKWLEEINKSIWLHGSSSLNGLLLNRRTSGDVILPSDDTTDIVLYPNPTTGSVVLKAADLTNVTLSDINGRVISNINITDDLNERTIDLTDIVSGVYFITTHDKSKNKKVKRLLVK